MIRKIGRKEFLKTLSLISGSFFLPNNFLSAKRELEASKMRLGLVTYLWGKDWDIPLIIKNCSSAGIYGVELRVEHAHGVNIEMTPSARNNVKKLFSGSDVQVLGMGTNQQYDFPDQNELRDSVERTKEFVKLSYDIGGSGVKVKPNRFHEGIPKEKTIEQIGKSLNEVAKFASDYGQQIRLEVHGKETQELPNIKAIMDVADHPNAAVCWNSNPEDLINGGLQYNFNLVKDRLGDTVHVRELDEGDYPYDELMKQLLKTDYKGWVLLECRTDPEDKVEALIQQRLIWEKLIKEG